MKYEVYGDTLFLLHFFYNMAVLYGINYKMHTQTKLLRNATAAALGAILTLALLWVPLAPLIKNIIMVFAIPFLVLRIAYPIRGFEGLEYLGKYYCFYTILFGAGFVGIQKLYREMGLWKSGVVCLVLFLTGFLLLKKKRREKTVKVELYLEQEKYTFEGFVDTGNTLMEPFTRKSVNVLVTENEVLRDRLMKGMGYVVPYRTIGTGERILMGYLVKKMCVITNGLEKRYEDVLVALSPERQQGEFVILSGLNSK